MLDIFLIVEEKEISLKDYSWFNILQRYVSECIFNEYNGHIYLKAFKRTNFKPCTYINIK